MAHSRFSPSSFPRVLRCLPSLLLSEFEPDNRSLDADHGTAAHHIGELCLKKDRDVDFYASCNVAVGPTGDTRFVHELEPADENERVFEVDDEMTHHVQRYVDWCRELPGEHFIEVRLEHTDLCPETDEYGFPLDPQKGTSDHVACEPGLLTVTDLKYGKGVKVYAEGNEQALTYAYSAYRAYDWIYNFKTIRIRIAQPRLDHFDAWEISVEELLAWADNTRERLKGVWTSTEFSPGEKQCRFCRRAGKCGPQKEWLFSTRALEFDDESGEGDGRIKFLHQLHTLTTEELSQAWQRKKAIDDWFKAIHRHLFVSAMRGEDTPGLKVVQGETHRKWRNPEATKALLLSWGLRPETIIETKMRSPAQIEIRLSDAQVKQLAAMDAYYNPPGKPCVVSVHDKRPAYERAAELAGGFDDESEDDFSDFDEVDDGF